MVHQTSSKLHKLSNPRVQGFSNLIEEKSLCFFFGFKPPDSQQFFLRDINYEEIAIDLEKCKYQEIFPTKKGHFPVRG